MMNDAEQQHARSALGQFIRAHREKLPPPQRHTWRRRTPGWRREELADAAGMGVTWVTWLEQGRPINASAEALARLAEALQLTHAERTSLFDLAGKRDPHASSIDNDVLPAELLQLPHEFKQPCYLLDPMWTARAWNRAAARLFLGWLDARSSNRNLLEYVFLNPQAQHITVDWAERAARLVNEFHADFNRHADDMNLQALVSRLCEQSSIFARHWRNQGVQEREGGQRSFLHPIQGKLHFQQTTLLVAHRQSIKLVCLQPIATKP